MKLNQQIEQLKPNDKQMRIVEHEAKEVQLRNEAEWVNGDKCVVANRKEAVYIGESQSGGAVVLISGTFDDYRGYPIKDISKPPTAEQKAAKEREEKARELCKLRCESFGHRYNWDTLGEKKKEGYRKMIDAGVQLPS